jgi:hypothetical protein
MSATLTCQILIRQILKEDMRFKWRKVVHKSNKINSEANIERRYQFIIDKIRLLRSQKVIINYFLIDI